VLVVNRFRITAAEAPAFRAALELARDTLGAQPGYVGGEIGRNADDPELWVLTTRWADVGSYRRGLGSYDAKMHAWPALTRALDEPSAYELVTDDTDLNIRKTRSLG